MDRLKQLARAKLKRGRVSLCRANTRARAALVPVLSRLILLLLLARCHRRPEKSASYRAIVVIPRDFRIRSIFYPFLGLQLFFFGFLLVCHGSYFRVVLNSY